MFGHRCDLYPNRFNGNISLVSNIGWILMVSIKKYNRTTEYNFKLLLAVCVCVCIYTALYILWQNPDLSLLLALSLSSFHVANVWSGYDRYIFRFGIDADLR